MYLCFNKVLQSGGVTWYWYGTGRNGKTTMMNALINNTMGVRLPAEGDSEEVYSVNGNKLKITNGIPQCEPPNMVTDFRQVFA
jgi:hypothetical protein